MVFLPTGLASRTNPLCLQCLQVWPAGCTRWWVRSFHPLEVLPCNLSSAIFLSDLPSARWFLRVRWRLEVHLWQRVRVQRAPRHRIRHSLSPIRDRRNRRSPEAKIFTGTVLKSGSQYVLRDSSGQVYKLDDTESAKPYEGKAVKVTGKLDEQAMLIHVQSIEGSEA